MRDLMARTDCYRDPSLDAPYPRQWPASAEIHLRDGRVLSTRVEFATGEPENPVGRDALIDKFVSLTNGILDEPPAAAERILTVDSQPDLGAVGAIVRGQPAPSTSGRGRG